MGRLVEVKSGDADTHLHQMGLAVVSLPGWPVGEDLHTHRGQCRVLLYLLSFTLSSWDSCHIYVRPYSRLQIFEHFLHVSHLLVPVVSWVSVHVSSTTLMLPSAVSNLLLNLPIEFYFSDYNFHF